MPRCGMPSLITFATIFLALLQAACTAPGPAAPSPTATSITTALASTQSVTQTTPGASTLQPTPDAGAAATGTGATTQPTVQAGTPVAGGELRQTDWPATLAKLPGVEVGNSPISGVPRPYVKLKEGELGGHPLYESIIYGDIGDDAKEEAIIPLDSGGTAGNVGFLVFGPGADGPRLIGSGGGYKQGLRVSENSLWASSAAYAGWEGNCCPSAFELTRYRVQEGKLVSLATRLEPFEEAKAMTVERFYSLIAQKEYQKAYAFLAPSFQQANPYDGWAAGYAGLKDFEYKVSKNGDGSVAVELDTREVESGGIEASRHYAGRWLLNFDAGKKQWLLQRAEISRLR